MHRKSRTSHACAGHFAPGRVAFIFALPVNPDLLFPVTLHFTSQQFCLEAEKTLEAQGVFANSAPASYQIFGKCIGSATVLK